MYGIGAATADVTGFAPGVGLMGWGSFHLEATGVARPLAARAFVFRDPESGRRLAFCCAEICFVTQAVREGVLARLPGWEPADVMLTATHTHCGPGGYAGHLAFDLMIPGFDPGVYEAIVAGMAAAIRGAEARLAPGRIRPAAGSFAPEVPVAFNRALGAHNANRDLLRRFAPDEAHLAVGREMFLLRLEDDLGNPLGAIDWFPVHGTSVHADDPRVSPDNKGFAAAAMEAALGGRVVTAFAQGAAGDVSPNFRRVPGKPWLRGADDDGQESARLNGEAQSELALALFADAGRNPALAGELDGVFGWFDLAEREVPPAFAQGFVGMRTGRSALGARLLGGTGEGPGLTSIEVDLMRGAAGLAKARALAEAFLQGADAYRRAAALARAQAPKDVFMEPHDRRILGIAALERLPLPDGRDPSVAWLRHLAATGRLGDAPWAPHVLPFQLHVLGPVALAAVPAELTTQAGRRLRASIAEVLAERGVTRVELTGYANAYAGYVTTPEEYDLQGYEGASTHFGRWTLGAYQAVFDALARALLMAPAERPRWPQVSPAPVDVEAAARLRGHAEAVAWSRSR